MSFGEAIAWLNQNLITPLFGFQLSFAGGITFGSLVVAIFGLPFLVHAFKKLF